LNALATCAGSECARLENDPLTKTSTVAGKGDAKEKSKSKKKGKRHRGKEEQRRSNRIAASRDHTRKSDVTERPPHRVSEDDRAKAHQRDRRKRVQGEGRRLPEQRDHHARSQERRSRG
jgi:hypothetical protein